MKRLFSYFTFLLLAFNFASCETGEETKDPDPVVPEVPSITVGDGEAALEISSDAQVVNIKIDGNTSTIWDVEVAAINDGDDIAWLAESILNPKVTAGIGLTFKVPQNDAYTFEENVEDEYGDMQDIVYTFYDRSAKLIFTTDDDAAQSVEVTVTQEKYAPAQLTVTIPVEDTVTGEMVATDYSVTPAPNTDQVVAMACTINTDGHAKTIEVPITTNRSDWTADVTPLLNYDLSRISITPVHGASGDKLLISLKDNNDSEAYTGFDVVVKAQEATMKIGINQKPLPKYPTEVIFWAGPYEYDESDSSFKTLENGGVIPFSGGLDAGVSLYPTVSWNIQSDGVGGTFSFTATDNDGNEYVASDFLAPEEYQEANENDWLGIKIETNQWSGKTTLSTVTFSENTADTDRTMTIHVFYQANGEEPANCFEFTVKQTPKPAPQAPESVLLWYSVSDAWDPVYDPEDSDIAVIADGGALKAFPGAFDKNDYQAKGVKFTIYVEGSGNEFGGVYLTKFYDATGAEVTLPQSSWDEDLNGQWITGNCATNTYIGETTIAAGLCAANDTGAERHITCKLFYAIPDKSGELTELTSFTISQLAQ